MPVDTEAGSQFQSDDCRRINDFFYLYPIKFNGVGCMKIVSFVKMENEALDGIIMFY